MRVWTWFGYAFSHFSKVRSKFTRFWNAILGTTALYVVDSLFHGDLSQFIVGYKTKYYQVFRTGLHFKDKTTKKWTSDQSVTRTVPGDTVAPRLTEVSRMHWKLLEDHSSLHFIRYKCVSKYIVVVYLKFRSECSKTKVYYFLRHLKCEKIYTFSPEDASNRLARVKKIKMDHWRWIVKSTT